jgi:hypothetical protein
MSSLLVSSCWYFRPSFVNYCPSNFLSGSPPPPLPPFPKSKYSIQTVHPQNVRFQKSGFKTSGFKTSETSGLQNVRFTKRMVYKMSGYKTSGLQNVRLQKNIHIYSVLVVGGNPQVMLQPCLQAK